MPYAINKDESLVDDILYDDGDDQICHGTSATNKGVIAGVGSSVPPLAMKGTNKEAPAPPSKGSKGKGKAPPPSLSTSGKGSSSAKNAEYQAVFILPSEWQQSNDVISDINKLYDSISGEMTDICCGCESKSPENQNCEGSSSFSSHERELKEGRSLLIDGPTKLSSRNLTLEIPRFKCEFGASELKDCFAKVYGLTDCFSAATNPFNRMFGAASGGPTQIDSILHKAVVEVDEKGII